ncbi:MAG: hypothetical protein M1376_09520 [Planctomycetes bacterium]|nr:hypothetical protein [Planctomycetota bacterium]
MKTKKMNETSWRTLMLLTTLFLVFVIFQGTVRTPKPSVARAKAKPSVAVHASKGPNQAQKDPNQPPGEPNQPAEEPNQPPDQAPGIQPKPVPSFAETHPAWLHDNLGDLNQIDLSSLSDSDDPNESPEPEPQ